MNEQNQLAQDMSDVIDGTATPEQVARLRQALAADPAAAELYREMRELHDLLRKLPREAPPPDLKPAVLRAIRTHRQATPPSGRWIETVKSIFARRPALGYAYVFAAGLALGALLLWLAPGRYPSVPLTSTDSLSGTMLPESVSGQENRAFYYSGGQVVITASPSTAGHDLHIAVQGSAGVEIVLQGVASTDSLVRIEVRAAGKAQTQNIQLAQ